MKKETIEFLKRKFEKELREIRDEIYRNTKEINNLAVKQRVLKEYRKVLTDLLKNLK